MNETYLALLSGLTGSIITVLIGKLLDIFQQQKQHRNNLVSKFFEKKLQCAESIITHFTINLVAYRHLSVLFERMSSDETNDVEVKIQKELSDEIHKQFQIANDASFILANSFSLYFDFAKDVNDNERLKSYYDQLAKAGALDLRSQEYYEVWTKYKGQQSREEEKAWDDWMKADDEFNIALKSLSQKFLEIASFLQSIIGEIRNEMRKYDR